MPRNWLLEAAMERRNREAATMRSTEVRADYAAGRNAHTANVLPASQCTGCGRRLGRNCKFEVCRHCRGPRA
jgi:hypothetical protein